MSASELYYPYRKRLIFGYSLPLLVLLGCAPSTPASISGISIAGNWQISSSSAFAVRLPSISGTLSGSGAAITGILHSDSTAACISPSAPIHLAGSADANGVVTLLGANVGGGTLRVTGTLAPNGQSFSDASYTVIGGGCAFANPAPALAQSYRSITGNYAGTFSDADGQVLAITASLVQSPESSTSGDFQLSGTGTLGANSCFGSPASISNSQVTGGTFSLTYVDPSLADTVKVSGTFSPDGATLTVTHWDLSGVCGLDVGTGLLTKQ